MGKCKQTGSWGDSHVSWIEQPLSPSSVHCLICGSLGCVEAKRQPHKRNICLIHPSKLPDWGLNFPIALLRVIGKREEEEAFRWGAGLCIWSAATLTADKSHTCSIKFRPPSNIAFWRPNIFRFYGDEVKFRLNNSLAAISKPSLLHNKTFKVTRGILMIKRFWTTHSCINVYLRILNM